MSRLIKNSEQSEREGEALPMEGATQAPTDDRYHISLESFEGPLDLLLHLIKKNDIDIYNIPIAKVLEEYLEFIEDAKELNIDLAGDFLLMAAELILIKSRLLMPLDQELEEEEGTDPREELVRRLLEYQRYKDAGEKLVQRPLLGKDVFKRGMSEAKTEEEETLDTDMTSLLLAFQDVLKRLPRREAYEIHLERISVQEKILSLTERLKMSREMKFQDLFEPEKGKGDVIVTFLALLEMAKTRMISVRQGQSFDDIFIVSRIENVSPDSLEQLEESDEESHKENPDV